MVNIELYKVRLDETKQELIKERYNNKEIEDEFIKQINELNEFFQIRLNEVPSVNFVYDRKTINHLIKTETRSHIIGWINGYIVYILELDNFETESSHKKYSKEQYLATIKHELVHIYFYQIVKCPFPTWLWEGTSVSLSGQYKPKIEKLFGFLEAHFGHVYGPEYTEAGFFVSALIKRFEKDKFLQMLNELSKINQDETENARNAFYDLFNKIYGFKLDYETANKLFRETKPFI